MNGLRFTGGEGLMDTFIGFDSAWMDNPKAPGAITAVSIESGHEAHWHPPQLVSFEGALAFIQKVRSPDGVTIVGLDQPTVVLNATGTRPVERVAASVISWMGGGVQPSNTGRTGMFGANAPVWRFLSDLGAVEDPEVARVAPVGLYVVEVYPALAIASLRPAFFGRLAGPRYNPARRRTFGLHHWIAVAQAAAGEADRFGANSMGAWCRSAAALAKPCKADQDRLDAALCALIAMRWRLGPRDASLLLGDLASGYMVLPINPVVRARLGEAARIVGVLMDGAAA
jgi:predicted RNase H-like nuclease